jgi:hypothetical protein
MANLPFVLTSWKTFIKFLEVSTITFSELWNCKVPLMGLTFLLLLSQTSPNSSFSFYENKPCIQNNLIFYAMVISLIFFLS